MQSNYEMALEQTRRADKLQGQLEEAQERIAALEQAGRDALRRLELMEEYRIRQEPRANHCGVVRIDVDDLFDADDAAAAEALRELLK